MRVGGNCRACPITVVCLAWCAFTLNFASGQSERDPKQAAPKNAMVLPVASNSVISDAKFDVIVTILNGTCRIAADILPPAKRPTAKPLSLRELGSALLAVRRAHESILKGNGGIGHERVVGERLSKLRALVRAGKDTPWQHVEWVSTILVESKYDRQWLACHRCAGDAYSDVAVKRLGLRRCDQEQKQAVIRLSPAWDGTAVREAGNAAPWPTIELTPGRPAILGEKAHWISELADPIQDATYGASVKYLIIEASRATPLHEVVACINAIESANCRALWLSRIPNPKVRKLPTMPTPAGG